MKADAASRLVGPVEVRGHSTVTRSVLEAQHPGRILVVNSEVDDLRLRVLAGTVQIIGGDVRGPDDLELHRPELDPVLWTIHRTPDRTWVAHAGCVQGIAVTPGGWDATTAPDDAPPALTEARQALYDEVAARLG